MHDQENPSNSCPHAGFSAVGLKPYQCDIVPLSQNGSTVIRVVDDVENLTHEALVCFRYHLTFGLVCDGREYIVLQHPRLGVQPNLVTRG